MNTISPDELLVRIKELEDRLEESEQLIEAIKAGEVDAFAIKKDDQSEIYTLQSGDYAYRVLIEEFDEGAVNVTEEGLIVYTNRYVSRLLDLPYEKIIGSSFFNLIHQDSRDAFNYLFEKGISGKSKGEMNLFVNNKIIPVYLSLTSLRPKLATVGITITDYTEKKNTEKVILDYQKNLENKNIELLQNNEELASFVYIASHDLQEPLRKIQTFASRLLDKELKNLSDKGQDHLNRMQVAAKRMQNLIKDLLAYSRTSSLEREFINTDLNEILDEVKIDLKEDLEQSKARIHSEQLCRADIIPFQFRQLLHNLIGNSLKFSKPEQPPRIYIKSEIITNSDIKREESKFNKPYCHIHISDDGIGFDPQHSEKIFDLFHRLHGSEQYDGTGIGLAIVKKIVANHKGHIVAKSEKNKGAAFDIYIPASPG